VAQAAGKRIKVYFKGDNMKILIEELICIALQLILFLPFYFKWRKDCREIGEDKLAVPLSQRFFTWVVFFPIWAVPLLRLGK
jgi:hypothetical protein